MKLKETYLVVEKFDWDSIESSTDWTERNDIAITKPKALCCPS